jgi:hypothetical protein
MNNGRIDVRDGYGNAAGDCDDARYKQTDRREGRALHSLQLQLQSRNDAYLPVDTRQCGRATPPETESQLLIAEMSPVATARAQL